MDIISFNDSEDDESSMAGGHRDLVP
jgi:hypothetical protein